MLKVKIWRHNVEYKYLGATCNIWCDTPCAIKTKPILIISFPKQCNLSTFKCLSNSNDLQIEPKYSTRSCTLQTFFTHKTDTEENRDLKNHFFLFLAENAIQLCANDSQVKELVFLELFAPHRLVHYSHI